MPELLSRYGDYCHSDSTSFDIFLLDRCFYIISKIIADERDSFNNEQKANFEYLEQNHFVLTELFEEMQQYRAALQRVRPQDEFPKEEIGALIIYLKSDVATSVIHPEVASCVDQLLNDDDVEGENDGARRRFDAMAFANRISSLVYTLSTFIISTEKTTVAAQKLWGLIQPLALKIFRMLTL